MEQEIQKLKNEVVDLKKDLESFKEKYKKHQHNYIDGTEVLRKTIKLDNGEFLDIGYSSQVTSPVLGLGTSGEQYTFVNATGPDGSTGFLNKSNNMQVEYIHLPNILNSFIRAYRKPLVTSYGNSTISTTAGGNTVTATGFNLTTNELAGAIININNSSGVFVESQTIASNTSSVITIDGTWGASTSGGSFLVYMPVFLGSAEVPFHRVSIGGEDVSGGTYAQKRVLRFDYGTTSGTQTLGVFIGTGSPESVVTANVGSLYLRKDGGATTTLYVKTSGTGNTGWTGK